MAVDNSSPEEGDAEESIVKYNEFLSTVMDATNRMGCVVIERSICPHCKGINYSCHSFAEIVSCNYDNCKKRYPSRVPRPARPGEIQAAHYELALGTLHEANRLMIQGGLIPLETSELNSLPDPLQKYILRHWVKINREYYEKINSIARQFAERGAV